MTLFNFTGAYKEQDFYREMPCRFVEHEKMPGCCRYCDDEAAGILLEDCRENLTSGVRFLDSGNYHYLSFLFLKALQERESAPVTGFLFDNHTDMQDTAFGGLLSCGSWCAEALRELPFLERVVLIGPEERAYEAVDKALLPRVDFFSRERLRSDREGSRLGKARSFIKERAAGKRLYLSTDKDILSPAACAADWDQGDMALPELLMLTEEVLRPVSLGESRLLGMDICGDKSGYADPAGEEVNRSLLALYSQLYH